MAVPKRKTSPSRRGMRRSADALKRPSYIEDKDSGELRMPRRDGEVFRFGTAMERNSSRKARCQVEAGLIEDGSDQG